MTIAYIVKRYPRYSETFIVNEILAHEAAGLDVHIFALRPPVDTHFQDKISRVKASVTYIQKPIQGRMYESLTSTNPSAASYFWAELQAAAEIYPNLWHHLEDAKGERASVVYQAAWLAQEIQRRGIRHLHAHFGSVATSVARLAAKFADVPYSFTAHAKDIFHDSVDPQDMQRKLRDAATVITVSDYNRAYLLQQYGAIAQKVTRLYNGMDLTELQYQPERSSCSTSIPRILSVSRFVEKKGLSDLIAACARLRDQGRIFQCHMIGTGPLESALRSQIQALHLEDWVEILGPRPQQQVFEQLRQATIFVAPYVIGADGNRDGLPTVLLEAMALGTACVATDVTGIPEVIRDGKTGGLVCQNNPQRLADALDRLLSQPTLRQTLAAQARSLIEAEFNITQTTAVLRSHFHSHAPAIRQLQEV